MEKSNVMNLSLTGISANKAIGIFAGTALSTYLICKRMKSSSSHEKLDMERRSRLIVITGCDTGLGYSMAVWAAKLGYKVLAGCLNENGEGAHKLRKQYPDQVTVCGLNVTDIHSLNNFRGVCADILRANDGNLRLWAIVANAAVCIVGEFLWQTDRQREQQMSVNFWGTVNFVDAFRTMLFETQARVIVISSDCSEYPLPYLSTYCASKAALGAWTKAFRMEVAKYGVHVVAYQPGDFHQKSGLFSNIEYQYSQMLLNMHEKDKNFYGEYFDNLMKGKLKDLGTNKKVANLVNSPTHKRSFLYILENDIQNTSIHADFGWEQKIFNVLYKFLPQRSADNIVLKALNPDNIQWQKPKN